MALENWVDKQDGIDDILAEDINSIANAVIETQEEINKIVIDQTYSPISENAQSGKAVAEAVAIEQKRSDNTFANALKGNKSDTAMLLDDASPVTHEMRVKVRSKNLLNFNKDNFVYTASSVEYLENGFVLIANSRRDTYAKLLNFEFKRGVQYTISFDIEIEDNNTANTAYVLFVSSNNVEWYIGDVLKVPRNSINNGKVKVTFTTPLDKDCNVFFSGTNLAPDITGRASFANIQIELGTTATAYTPYVPDLTAVKVTRRGKNLIPLPYTNLPIGTTILNGIEFTVYEDGSILMNGTATTGFARYLYSNKQDLLGLRAGDIITGSKWVSDDSQKANFNVTFNYYNIDGDMEEGAINLGAHQNLTTTITEDYVGWGIYIYISSGKTFDNLLFKPQLELGKTATDYEPYVEPTYYIPNADGTVNGITSLYPNTTLMTDTDGVIIECEYNKDINKFSGADDWVLVAKGEVTEEVDRLKIDKDMNGNDFKLTEFHFRILLLSSTGNTANAMIRINNTGLSGTQSCLLSSANYANKNYTQVINYDGKEFSTAVGGASAGGIGSLRTWTNPLKNYSNFPIVESISVEAINSTSPNIAGGTYELWGRVAK